MVEHDIAVVIGGLFAADLHGAIQNLIHPLDVAVRADDGGEVLQRSLQRIVQAGDHQQKHEEGQNVQFALDQQRCAREGGSGDAQPQNKPAGRQRDDGKRHRQRPDGGKRHAPVEKQHRHGNDFTFSETRTALSFHTALHGFPPPYNRLRQWRHAGRFHPAAL